jgi:NAD(P)-dependent dehydrogenase (short-subunit alcohol dehydrogenase family)
LPTLLITGGGRGIGAEVAGQAVELGYEVYATVRRAPDRAPAGLRLIAGVDLLAPETIGRLGDALGGRPIDLLINNSGVIGPARQSTLDMDFDGFRATLEVNTLGPLRVTQSVLANLRAARDRAGIAKVLTITSQMGRLSLTSSDRIAYRASKAAVNKVMQGLATDLSRENIAVQLVHPGWVKTDMGGRSAAVTPAESAAGILARADALTMAATGTFVDYSGTAMPW